MMNSNIRADLVERLVKLADQKCQTPNELLEQWLADAEPISDIASVPVENIHELVLQNMSEGVIATDDAFRINFWNRGAEAIYGWKAEDVLGRIVEDVICPELDEGQLQDMFEQLASNGNYRFETIHHHKDGTPIHIQGVTVELWDAVKKITSYVFVNRDITTCKDLEAKLHRQARQAEAYAEISQHIAEARLDYQTVLDGVVRRINTLIGDSCIIRLLSEDRQWLIPAAFHHLNPEADQHLRELHATTHRKNEGVYEQVIKTGQSSLLTFLTKEEALNYLPREYHSYVERFGLYSAISVPLRVQGEIIGVIGVMRHTPGHFYTQDDHLLLQILADRIAIAIRNARLYEEVRNGREQMQQLARQVVTAHEDERRHIAYELHDEAGQALTALKISLEMIRRDLPVEFDEFRLRMQDAVELTDSTLEFIRLLAKDLRPPALDTLDLNVVLEDYCHSFMERTHLSVIYEGEKVDSLRDTTTLYLYRFLQESLTNVLKHAKATQIKVSLKCEQKTIHFSVEDNGQGFDFQDIFGIANPGGIGLTGIRDRLQALGGQLEINSALGRGTKLIAHLPC